MLTHDEASIGAAVEIVAEGTGLPLGARGKILTVSDRRPLGWWMIAVVFIRANESRAFFGTSANPAIVALRRVP